MADNYLITGYWGQPHVTAENDRGIHAGIFGKGRFVLPVGEELRAEYIGNNTVRIYDGKLINNGAAAGIPAGSYVDLLIPNAGQGRNRNDLIVFQYSLDSSTLIETGEFVVIPGEETSGTASDPAYTQADLLTGEATFDQMPLYRVSLSGSAVSAPVQLFDVCKSIPDAVAAIPATLPNPNALTFTGGVTGSYDGTAAKSVAIPTALKCPNKLTINGVTYDGSAAKDMTDTINALIATQLGVIENGTY